MATTSNPAKRRGMFFPLNLMFALLASVVICALAAAVYIAISHFAYLYDFAYVKLAVVLWLGLGVLTGGLVAKMARAFGVRSGLLVLVVALATGWLFFVLNWAGWTWFTLDQMQFRGGFRPLLDQIITYASLPPQEWLEAVAEWAEASQISFSGSIGDMFTTAQVYWLESGVMSAAAGLTVLLKTRQ